jgi:hypothetical protein
MGDEAKALQNLQEAITVDRSIMDAERTPAAWQNDLSYALLLAARWQPKTQRNLLLRGDLGGALKELGDAERFNNEFESGLINLNEALSIFGPLTKKDPNNFLAISDRTYSAESRIVLQKGRDALLSLEQKNFLSAVDKTMLTDIQNALNRKKGQGAQN